MSIFVDLDLVLADFTSAALTLHSWTVERFLAEHQLGTYWMHNTLGMGIDDFWRPIQAQGIHFWSHQVPPLPWMHDVVELLAGVKWFIATSPFMGGLPAYIGKQHWVNFQLPDLLDRTLVTNHKHLLAAARRILIDDSENNIDQWEDAGGTGILFPSWCNKLYELRDDPVPYVRQKLEECNAVPF